ncbi:MAG: hypothetical protein QF645_12390, partial [Planctomycetota bacterium]|nr:hypothetical protein [Planctomycetota bacterium]
SFDIDKTVNFTPLEEGSADDFDIDKTVNFAPLEEDAPVEDVDLEAMPVSEGSLDSADMPSGEDVPVEDVDLDATAVSEGDLDTTEESPAEEGVDEEGDLDAEVEASSIELPPDEDEGESKTLPRGTRRRNLPPANVKRRSAAANYQKTSKPGKSFLVKKILFFFIPLSLIAMLVAGFFSWSEGADAPWIGLLKKMGVMDATTPEGGESGGAEARLRPEVADFQTLQQRIAFIGKKVETIERDLRVTDTWTQENAMKARGELDTALNLLTSSTSMVERLQSWFETYSEDYEELQKAHEGGDKTRVDELNAKLERDKYNDVDFDKLGKGHVVASVNRLKALQRRADSLDNRIPSMEEIGDGKLPEGRKKGGGGSHGGGTSVSFNPSIVTPYFDISVGAWKRVEIVTEDLALFGEPTEYLEDTILTVKDLRVDSV